MTVGAKPPPATTTTTATTAVAPHVFTDAAIQVFPYVSPTVDYEPPITAGDALTFDIQVGNRGARAMSGLIVGVSLPTGVSVVSLPSQCTGALNVTCQFGSVAVQSVGAADVDLRFNQAGTFRVTFTLFERETDDDPANNKVTVSIVVADKPAAPAPKPNPAPKGVHKTGNAKNNTLSGTRYADVLKGMGGNDTLEGLGGNDTLVGGAGNDTLIGGTGKDTIRCGPGKDTVVGAKGDKVARDCEKRR